PAGRYEIKADLMPAGGEGPATFVALEAFSAGRYRAVAAMSNAAALAGESRLQFEVHEDETPTGILPVEVRVWAIGSAGLIKSLRVRRCGDATSLTPWVAFPSDDQDWLPFMTVAPPMTVAATEDGGSTEIEYSLRYCDDGSIAVDARDR